MAQIRRIQRTDPLYPQERSLREEVLLNPIGLDLSKFERVFPGIEERFEHFVAVTHRPGMTNRGGAGERLVMGVAAIDGAAIGSSGGRGGRGGAGSGGGGPCVIGCAALLPNHPSPGIGKLMQMAVDRQRQGEGIGRRLVVAVEARAFGELGLKELVCHAQLPAIGFYEKLGWEIDSEEFLEAGIPHRRMKVRAPEGVPAPDDADDSEGTP